MSSKTYFEGFKDGIFKYDINQSSIELIDTLPSAQSHGGAHIYGDYIYLVGSYPLTYNINAFNWRNETLSTSKTLTTTIQIRSTSGIIINDDLWIFGGQMNSDPFDTVQMCGLLSMCYIRYFVRYN